MRPSTCIRQMWPIRTLTEYLTGPMRTDIFLQVLCVTNGDAIWAHFKSLAVYPSALRVTGTVAARDVSIVHGCCTNYLRCTWSSLQLYDLTGALIVLPNKGTISRFNSHAFTEIRQDEMYQVRLMCKVLDLYFEIPTLQGTQLRQSLVASLTRAMDDLPPTTADPVDVAESLVPRGFGQPERSRSRLSMVTEFGDTSASSAVSRPSAPSMEDITSADVHAVSFNINELSAQSTMKPMKPARKLTPEEKKQKFKKAQSEQFERGSASGLDPNVQYQHY